MCLPSFIPRMSRRHNVGTKNSIRILSKVFPVWNTLTMIQNDPYLILIIIFLSHRRSLLPKIPRRRSTSSIKCSYFTIKPQILINVLQLVENEIQSLRTDDVCDVSIWGFVEHRGFGQRRETDVITRLNLNVVRLSHHIVATFLLTWIIWPHSPFSNCSEIFWISEWIKLIWMLVTASPPPLHRVRLWMQRLHVCCSPVCIISAVMCSDVSAASDGGWQQRCWHRCRLCLQLMSQ